MNQSILSAMELLTELEGFRAKAYKCPANVWTVGYGATGKDINRDTVWTEEQAEEDLHRRLVALYKRLAGMCAGWEKYTYMQHAALLSFVYNIGETNFRSSTMLKKLNRNQPIEQEFERWVYVNGIRTGGLERRRRIERDTWMKGYGR